MKAIITEKPSVAQDIARVLNITKKRDGYFYNDQYLITWALGHLTVLALPSDYEQGRLKPQDLPFIPKEFKLIVRRKKTDKGFVTDQAAVRQLKVIENVFEQCDGIIAATDAGREGELIFRFIYSFLGCKKPFQRLWINSMTDEAIRAGFAALRKGSEYNHLYQAAYCRAKADWLIGINASQALCFICGEGNNSLGRVQTPTLAMVCSRFLENTNFIAQNFWQLKITLQKNGMFRHFSTPDNYTSLEEAEKRFNELLQSKTVIITKIEKKEVTEQPPLLYDLTELQREANNLYGFSAENTLKIAQKLYESKYISYPRTGSRYLPKDVFTQTPPLLNFIVSLRDFRIFEIPNQLNERSINTNKVTDHHAIIVTGIKPENLIREESLIYNLIAGRMLESFYPACKKDSVSVEALCGTMKFFTKGSTIKYQGWRSIYMKPVETEEGEEKNTEMPDFTLRELLPVRSHNLVGKKTRPRPLYTEATLLTAMENCGRELTDEAQKEALKDLGIGTPATRASIISTLFSRDYMERSGKSILPTERGLFIYHSVKDMQVSDVALSGAWEKTLSEIERGEFESKSFMTAIEHHSEIITKEVLSIRKEDKDGTTCPKCNNGQILINSRTAKCNNESCGLIVFRKFLNKELTEQHLEQLFSSGKTKLIKGFKGQKNISFDAYITFDHQLNTVFEFPEKNQNKKREIKIGKG